MIAVWMPVTVVPTSLATVAIDTFITELSSVIRNCAGGEREQHDRGRAGGGIGASVAASRDIDAA